VSEPDQREEVLFEAARQLPTEQRAAYLDQACAGDPALRRGVEALLGALERAGGFLTQPAVTVPGDAPITEKAGDRIGRYKLLQEIGEGGCGVVYMAEQEDPVRRRVALKVIKLGMDTKQVVARFEAERQALALMDHPNIAKVLDAGATETGRPYFVMELVRGVPITEYCDKNNLSTRQRLELFIPICKAIQHAHQKGVIHRDIKPSNILVTLHDGVPVPKVIDFGIAKAIDQPLTEKTLFTRFEQFLGTPAYMSPEQAEMSGLDIDTRSDIYALGVLLYELLTGKPPFDGQELAKLGLDEMRRTICEQDPPKPSTRLSAMAADELTTTAQHRQTESPKLVHIVRGDLDWIVMKCLEKDRTRRYETANGLAADVLRHLNNEPVVARPPSRLYEFQKTVRRHKFGFGAAAALIMVLAAGVIVSTSEAIRATRAVREQVRLRQQAEADEKKAQTEAARSAQTAQFLKDMLNGVGPSVALGRDTTMLREILDKTAERLDNDLRDQPEVEAELRSTIGSVYSELGAYQKAEAMHRQALAMNRKLFGDESLQVALSLDDVAMDVFGQREQLAAAEAMGRESLAMLRKLLGREHRYVAIALFDLASVLPQQGKLAEAEITIREALAMQRKLLGDEHRDVATSLDLLGTILVSEGKLAEAEGYLREALAKHRKLLGNEHPYVASALGHLARMYRAQGRLADAEVLSREALAMRRQLLGTEHPSFGGALASLASTLMMEQKFVEAEPFVRELLAIQERTVPDHWWTFDDRSLVGACLLGQKKYAEAEPLLLSGYEGMKKREATLSASGKVWLKDALERVIQLYEETDRPDQAAEWKQKLADFEKAEAEKKANPPQGQSAAARTDSK
jgi:serine/threonine protein kinase/tetratricopeptide (TPR) repeat protein